MDKTHDDPFLLLAQCNDSEIDLGLGALLIAKDTYPELDTVAYVELLDRMASEVKERIDGTDEPSRQIAHLNHYLFEEKAFGGDQEDYYNPRNSYLNDVLERKLGIPITLSVVYIETSKRIGLPIVGVGFPGHFIVKHKGKHLETYIDPFHGGRILTDDALHEQLETVFQQPTPLQPEFLRQVSNKEILARILRNLKQIYLKKQAYARAISASERITWLLPDFAQEHQDLGYLYYKTHAYGKSLKSFQEYLRISGDAPDREDIEENIGLLRKQVASLN
ncbi:MAG: transglutaminase-like domain-containing protein [Candidatus Poribacteria bacterium]|nr:transglutaminase-like domain-containing protein [Candidatus Poribacteria bacterium]